VRKTARRVHRIRPEAGIVITGCAVPRAGEELTDLPSQAVLVPQRDKPLLQNAPHLSRPCVVPSAPRREAEGRQGFPGFSISAFPRARPVLKVQDGCSKGCTYCIVPFTRGPSRSREPKDILAEANRLLQAGYHELVLSGINLGQYAKPSRGLSDFWDLLHWLEERMVDVPPGSVRLRMSSLEPNLLQAKGLDVLSQSRLVCPHLHVSLQSASPGVLRRMGRDPMSAERVSAFVEGLRGRWPLLGLGADLLVGFPGETAQDFEETLAFCREMPFSYGHVFVYSPRPGTKAKAMEGQVGSKLKKERSRALREVLTERRERFLARLARESRVRVALEDAKGSVGLCEHYAVCRFDEPLSGAAPGALANAAPVGVSGGELRVRCASGTSDFMGLRKKNPTE
jgi:MiaB/RimO family radical SAM methylthiotransferase